MAQASSTRPRDLRVGVALIVGSVFLLSFGDALVKLTSADLSLWQLYVARSLIAVPLLVALLGLSGRAVAIKPRSPGWVLVRSMLLVSMWITYYAALPMMSLSAAAAVLYTTPLFTALFAALLLGEPVRARHWCGIAIGFAGVVVILRPDTDAFSVVALLPVTAAICYALAAVITRSKCAEERPLVLALGLNLCLLGVGAIATGALAFWGGEARVPAAYRFLLGPWRVMGAREWAIVALLGVLMVAVSTGVAKAYLSAPAAVISTFDYAYLVFAVFWGAVIFAEAPDGAAVTGMALIAAAGGLVVGRPGKDPRSLRPTPALRRRRP